MIKTFFFDFDGVIVDSVNIKTKAFAELFAPEGPEVVRKVEAYHLQNTGVSRYDKIRYIYSEILKRPLSDDLFQDLCDKFSNLVFGLVLNARYIKGAKEFLGKYSGRFDYFLISATPQPEMEKIVMMRGIDKLFKAVYGAPNKKTEAVREVIVKQKLNPAEAVYVGDAMSDYEAAKDNSVRFIAMISGDENMFSGLDCLKIGDFFDLERIVFSL